MRKLLQFTVIFFLGLLPFFAQASNPDTIRTATHVNLVKTYCVDTTPFAGNMVSLINSCDASSGVSVNFVIAPNFCVSYGGLELGTEQACLVFCDDTGQCDTTVLIVTVVEDDISLVPLIAVNDAISIHQDEMVTLDVTSNDILPNDGAYTSLRLLDQAVNGTGALDANGVFTYTPTTGFCGGQDSLTYEICNIMGCDTAQIKIEVAPCVVVDGLYIYDGFSPNEDFVNEHWKILGLEDYPNHQIKVFNRWGNEVFEATHYQNDWDGKWEESPLTPGTYFYLIDDGAGKKYTGYLQISY